jgi:hypothetical protein
MQFGKEIIEKIDIEVRAAFPSGATTGIIKSTCRYNHFGNRHTKINKVGI